MRGLVVLLSFRHIGTRSQAHARAQGWNQLHYYYRLNIMCYMDVSQKDLQMALTANMHVEEAH